MTNFRVRASAAIALVAGWAAACGGSSFTASGGDSGSGGTSASAGSGHAGSAQAGSSQAGGSQAGTSQGGLGQGGLGQGGLGQGGSGKGGSGKGGSGQAGSGQGGSGQGGSGQAGSGHGGSGGRPAGGTGGAPSGGMSGGGNAGAGGLRNSGDCDIDKQCGNGKCVTLSVGGFRTCVLPVPPPTTCTANDQCCVNSPDKPPCMTGTCLAGPLAPSCGGITILSGNTCVVNQCTQNSDCIGNSAICAPAGSLDRKSNTCLPGGCRRDSECNAEAGGKCEPVTNHCCTGVTGLYCVYPSTGCRSQADCASGFCQTNNNRADCMPGIGACPL